MIVVFRLFIAVVLIRYQISETSVASPIFNYPIVDFDD